MNGEAWIKSLQTIDCLECETLLAGWLAGDVTTADICRHVHSCPITQARLTAIPAGPPAPFANPTQTTKGGTPSPGLETRRGVPAELAAERLVEV